MGYFPLCVDLSDKTVLLVGSGSQIQDKEAKLRPFGPRIIRREILSAEDLNENPALVVAGDLPWEEARKVAALCSRRNIPVNVVDAPDLCSFVFPALISEGPLTVSVSTGGEAPAAAAYLRRKIQEQLPDKTEEILLWLGQLRQRLRQECPETCAQAMKAITAAAFSEGRVLTEEEWRPLTK